MFKAILSNLILFPLLSSAQRQSNQNLQQTFAINAKRKWDSHNVLNYKFQYTTLCRECCWKNTCSDANFPWTVQINSDRTLPMAVDSRNARAIGMTIEDLFSDINAALADPQQYVEVVYDSFYGHPTRIYIQTGTGNNKAITTSYIGSFTTLFSSQYGIFQTHRRLWSQKRKTSYDYTYYNMTGNPLNLFYPLTVKVRSNVVTEVRDSNNNRVNLARVPTPPTIDQYFDQINTALTALPTYIENTYNGAIGYPTSMLVTTTSGFHEIRITNYEYTNIV